MKKKNLTPASQIKAARAYEERIEAQGAIRISAWLKPETAAKLETLCAGTSRTAVIADLIQRA